ncbi:MAG TPA: RodZ domain-containing protein [Pseudogracilibacillus sp.]|nr:RodZ domain-containing protein [Pseudogracilibacillus sp.]
MEIGQLLKEERKAQELSLDEIQEMTKIQKRYLQAIEDNNFDSLPGRFYARAFIKEYALVLNMDEELLLQNFDGGEVEEEDQTQYTNVRRSRRPRAPKSSTVLSFLPTVIVIVLIVAVLFIAWMLTQKALTSNSSDPSQPTESDEIIRDVEQGEKEQPVSEDEEEEEEDKDSEKEEQSQFESQFEVDEIGSGTSPQSELTFTYAEEELLLTFDVEAEAYVSIVGESNKNYFDGILEPNSNIDPIDLSDESNVFLNIGNTSGVTVKLNDLAMDYPISPSEKVHQKFLINFKKHESN